MERRSALKKKILHINDSHSQKHTIIYSGCLVVVFTQETPKIDYILKKTAISYVGLAQADKTANDVGIIPVHQLTV